MRIAILFLLVCCSAVAQDMRLLTFQTDTSVVLRWIGNTNPSIDAWSVGRSVDGGVFTSLTAQPLTRVLSHSAAADRVGAYKAGYYLMLFGVDGQRSITQQDVQKTLTSPNVGFHFAMLAAQPELSDLTGERFEDVSIPQGARSVRYRVVGSANGIEVLNKETKSIERGSIDRVPVPDSVVVEGLDNTVRLRWSRNKQQSDRGDVVGFRIWKSDGESGPFEEMTSMSSLVMFGNEEDEKWYSWTDDFIDNGATAYYYVRQVHGTGVLGDRSEIVRVTSGQNVSPLPPVSFQASVFGVAIQLAWELSDVSVKPTSIQVQRRVVDGKSLWTSMDASVSDQSYLDALVEVGVPYHYMLVISNGDRSVTSDTINAFIPDAVAPEPPTSVRAVEDTGRVILKWTRSASMDVVGYHVFRSSDSRRITRLQLTEKLVSDTSYIDILQREAEGKHGYFVTAEDRTGNTSEPSVTVVARTTDVTPPVAPQIVEVKQGEIDAKQGTSEVTIAWTSSRSADLRSYLIEIADSTQRWKLYDSSRTTRASLKLTAPGYYTFRVLAVDSSMNRSKPSTERSVTFERELVAPTGLLVEKRDVDLKVQWQPVVGCAGYRIVRIDPRTGTATTCATLGATQTSWLDKFSQRDREWKYQVAARSTSWKYGPAAEHTYQPPKE